MRHSSSNNGAPEIALATTEFFSNPYPTYRLLLESGTPQWLPQLHRSQIAGMWLFGQYQDAVEILRMSANISKDLSLVIPEDELSPSDINLMFRDPPDHTRLRNLIRHVFAMTAVNRMAPMIEAIVDELLDRVLSDRRMDFIKDFAMSLPTHVICELLGVPKSDRQKVQALSVKLLQSADEVINTQALLRQREQVVEELDGYFSDLILVHRQDPGPSIISRLIDASDNEGNLTGAEMLGMFMILLIGGQETTTHMLGNGLYTLLRHPDQLAMLKSNKALLPSAIEEILRFESPLQRSTFRVTTDSCVIGGYSLQKGEQICAVIGAANRDPRQFPSPDVFDITRKPNHHLAFGLGVHICLGASLARLEGKISFTKIFEKMPKIRLVDEAPEWRENTLLRGLSRLDVEF